MSQSGDVDIDVFAQNGLTLDLEIEGGAEKTEIEAPVWTRNLLELRKS